MYFNDKNNTNIDNEFGNENTVSKLLKFINKYKIIIIVSILLIIGVIAIISLSNNESSFTETTYYLDLKGNEEITLYTGSDYIEPGYDAYNSKEEDMDSEVEISSNLDTSTPGEYIITYTIGEVSKTRKIMVIEKPLEYAYIYLKTVNNNVNVYIKVGEDYVEPGYMVFSSTGKTLVSDVTVTGKVDTSKKGSYKLVYSLVDSNGVTVTASRTVIVMDSEISLTLSTNEYTNKDVTINLQVMDNYFDYMILPDKSKVTKNTASYKVTKNGTYTFVVYSTKGTKKEASIKVSNIDKTAPTGSCSGNFKDGVSMINVTANDNNGIKKYVINNKEYTSSKITVNNELKTASITIYDKAGNTKTISCDLEDRNIRYKREFSVKYIDLKNGRGLSYWLYIPEGATDNMPLVVYLHGTEGKGNDYKYNTKKAITYGPGSDIYNNRREYNAIILMPQIRYGEDLNGAELMELIEYIVDTYKINEKKVSIAGMSEGGYHLGVSVGDYANYFSVIVFLATYPYYPEKFVSVPVITVCGELDYERINTMKYFSKRVNELGGNATHYTLPGLGHTIVDNDGYSVFRDEKYDLVDWMVSHTRK